MKKTHLNHIKHIVNKGNYRGTTDDAQKEWL